jgi:phosphoribosylanthranilate isomerase
VPHLVPLLIRGINNLSDARYCAGMGADKLTFVLDPALPGALDTKTVIGEFDRLSAHEINAIAAECGLDAILLRSFRTTAELAEIAPPVYQELTVEDAAATHLFTSEPTGFVIELPTALSPENLDLLRQVASEFPLWVGPGLAPERASELAANLRLSGLSFPSGDEVKPGLRDFDQLEAVFEALETE